MPTLRPALAMPVPSGLVRYRVARLCAFVSHERVGGDGAENAQAVFRFLVVDGMAAHNNGARLDDFFEASAQHIARHVFRQGRIHGDHVERHIGHAAHGKNVGKRVGGGDSPEVVGLIDDRRKEINRQNARDVRRDSPYGSVVGRVEAEHGFGRHRLRNGDVFQNAFEVSRTPLRRSTAT